MVSAFLLATGSIVAVLALYLVVLAIASFRLRPRASATPPTARLVVLVPAHDEEELIGRCVDSLREQRYPDDLYRIVVVADNCSDSTAAVARRHGAHVLVRDEPEARGKGRALRWAMDLLLAGRPLVDGVVIVDADSVADKALLVHLAAGLESGHQVVQADYQVLRQDRSMRSELAAAAFLLFHRVRFSGRAALRLPANLVGNGMLFSRQVLQQHPWDAFSAVEDLELSLNLRLAGVKPAFAPAALVRGPQPSEAGATTGQRVRWEGGRWNVVRRRFISLVVEIVRRRRFDLADAALDLAVPPLGLLLLASAAGLAVSAGAVLFGAAVPWTLVPWALALACLPAFVLLGLRSARAPASTFLALLSAPRFLAWKMLAYIRILRGFDPQRWEDREAQRKAVGGASFEVADVRIDPVDMKGAMERIDQALDRPGLYQVSTVNLDFLVRAQQMADVRAAFGRSSLNVADGAPVVWLGRLLGNHLPERVAGADLVPLLMNRAAERGASVFLLGGEDGVSTEAARRLAETNPGLRIAGCFEPPLASLDEIDSERILALIDQSGADIVLVALGHPKQELWIDRNRDRLTCRVAIGVGCVFDLIAGRQRRAPLWMQRSGLEWLHRVMQEPRRLLGRYTTDLRWLMLMTLRIFWQRLRVRPA